LNYSLKCDGNIFRFIGNAGAVSQDDLKKDYGKLLINDEETTQSPR
jgi:hypothetical protein